MDTDEKKTKDGRDIPDGTELSTQVCIIGSGPAGVTAAWYLQKAGIKVILIEGSREYANLKDSWPDKRQLYNGVADGLFTTNERDFLILPYDNPYHQPASERERFYGGTSAHWGGQSRPEDPIDLEERPGFPGWPMTRPELDPYYAEASAFCLLAGNYGPNGENFSNEYWSKVLQAPVPALDGFDVEMYQFIGGNLNFAQREFNGEKIEDKVEVILNASLLNIDHQQGTVSKLEVASMDTSIPPKKATTFTIKADAYVLACGAVANARQLLLSNAGNEYDQVGRYFMCHPLTQSSVISVSSYLSSDESRFMGGQKSNFTPWTDANGVTVNARFIPNREQTKKLGIGRCWFWYQWGQYYFEQTPNPDSRITLADTLDPVFSQRQTKATWLLSDSDQNTYNETIKLFQTALSNHNPKGTVTYPPWEALKPQISIKTQLVVNGHHIGTTRMHKDPKQGVVDANQKVHSLNNLYVAGSSVFPSAGISNPTFTIITLSIRLADYLRKQLTGS